MVTCSNNLSVAFDVPWDRTKYSYDATGRIASLTHSDGQGTPLADYSYDYDLAGRLVEQILNGQSTTYGYDNLDQLTSAASSTLPDESFAFDENGNRIGGGVVVGTANQILSDGTFDYTYDAEGNLATKTEIATGEVTTFTYDARNRLVHAERLSAGGILLSEVTYVYDVFDRRISRIVDSDGDGPGSAEEQHFVYDRSDVWAEFDETGALIARYLFGQNVDEVLARFRPGEGTAWYLTDRLGSVRDIADAASNLVNHIEYGAFGDVLSETNPAMGDRYKFTGREFDPELGLYYYRARFYDPVLGRFTSQDPLGFAAGDANLYRYVGNSPTNATDPSGLLTLSERVIFHTAGGLLSFVGAQHQAQLEGRQLSPGEGVIAAVLGAVFPIATYFDVLTRALIGSIAGPTAGRAGGLGAAIISAGIAGGPRGLALSALGAALGAGIFSELGGDPLTGAEFGSIIGPGFSKLLPGRSGTRWRLPRPPRRNSGDLSNLADDFSRGSRSRPKQSLDEAFDNNAGKERFRNCFVAGTHVLVVENHQLPILTASEPIAAAAPDPWIWNGRLWLAAGLVVIGVAGSQLLKRDEKKRMAERALDEVLAEEDFYEPWPALV